MKSFIGALLVVTSLLRAQDDTATTVKATEFTTPSSPAFVLLDVLPAQVVHPGFSKDFSMNLLVKDQKLVSDLAIDFKPVWIFFFDQVDLAAYQKKTDLERALSTISLSAATVEKDSTRKFAWSIKMSVIRNDPLQDQEYYRAISLALNTTDKEIQARLGAADSVRRIKQQLTNVRDSLQLLTNLPDSLRKDSLTVNKINSLKDQINNLEAKLITEGARQIEETREIQRQATEKRKKVIDGYLEKHWNDDALDIAAGWVYAYDSPSLDSLRFTSRGFGVWLNLATGLGTEKWLFSALLRGIDQEEEFSPFLGMNVRYGKSDKNTFLEFIFQRNNDLDFYTIAYGGELYLGARRSIEFGLRHQMDRHFHLAELVPTLKVNWGFGSDLLN